MEKIIPFFTPIKSEENQKATQSLITRPRPLEIPLNCYYHKWIKSDKIFEGKYSGPSTPLSPNTPALDFLHKKLRDITDYTTPVLPKISRFTLKEPESPCFGHGPNSAAKFVETPKSRYDHDFIEIDEIGSGEFGKVFKCVHKIDGLQYAVKKILTYPSKKSSISTALQEASVLATSSIVEDNAYIVRYHSVWLERDSLYISMELCEGSLAKYIKEHEVNEALLRKILRDVCKALKKLHSHNIVHMDIKAENILHSFSHKFKLGDLGLGRITTSLGDIREGDARYLAREVLAQATDNPDHVPDLTKADIFSLGATCYEIMRNKTLPKNGPEWHSIRNGNLENCNGFSNEINQHIKKMMDPSPELRPSAQELLSSVLLSEKQLQVKKLRNYATELEHEIDELKEKLGLKKRKLSM